MFINETVNELSVHTHPYATSTTAELVVIHLALCITFFGAVLTLLFRLLYPERKVVIPTVQEWQQISIIPDSQEATSTSRCLVTAV